MAAIFRPEICSRDRSLGALARSLAAVTFDATFDDVSSEGRLDHHSSMVRRYAIYIAHVGFEWSQIRVADVFGMSETNVRNAVRRVEDQRDQPKIDDALERLTETAALIKRRSF